MRKVIFAQAIGGLFFAFFGGQPMIILLTTVPLAIYIKGAVFALFSSYRVIARSYRIFFLTFFRVTEPKNPVLVIYKISQELGYDFFAMYACVGLFCQMFLIIYAGTELCSLMKLATR